MLDYRGIEALAAVISEQSFEKAAQKLFITQPAISQRIRNLEEFYGAPLMIRSLPYRPTELGKHLIGHFKQLALLEADLALRISKTENKHQLSIGLNRDSLETWFMQLLEKRRLPQGYLIEIIADDQELLLDHFRNGVVDCTMSPSPKKVSNAQIEFLGSMEYALVASPQFKAHYFSRGVNAKNIAQAPALQFDKNDSLHRRYLDKFFALKNEPFRSHFIPSVQGFKKFTLSNLGYALLPILDIEDELAKGSLVNLAPHKLWQEPIYWHYLTIQSDLYQKFMQNFITETKKLLTPS